MEYSAAAAPISWSSLFFVAPALLMGLGVVIAAALGKVRLRGVPAKFGRLGNLVGGIAGAVFLGFATFVIVAGALATYDCANAVANNKARSVEGDVQVVARTGKSGFGHVNFRVGDTQLTTSEGLSCDCGFLVPLGKHVYLENGVHAEAKIYRGIVVYFRTYSKG